MPNYVIYHNPSCSKSRATLALLQENNLEPEIIEYLDNPPSTEEVEHILALLKYQPIELMRTNEATFTSLNLAAPTTTNKQLVEAMVGNPILIERPIVLRGNQAIIGRPPERVLDLI
ncbi:MAG: arsenate reductase [Candidatus Azotimanducaceae bacterium]|jgi:arsenate reductase|tara:strand:- start:1006 stop:1356 length:351 start_codon:yes stop_codon:yes gene_type:complete